MPSIKVLSTKEVEERFNPKSRRKLREEEMMPYHEAVSQLGSPKPGGVVDLGEGDNPRQVMMRLHKAARDRGLNLRFKRQGSDGQNQLVFRLQSEEETKRLKERGQKLAQSRQAKGGSRKK
jgi:hypothetical protein